jgi:hypothetical protein
MDNRAEELPAAGQRHKSTSSPVVIGQLYHLLFERQKNLSPLGREVGSRGSTQFRQPMADHLCGR